MASIEELLKQLIQGNPRSAGVALEDPEYQLDLSQVRGELGEDEAEYLANTTSTQARYERMRREAARQVPKDITNVKESAAARGMLYAGGRVEAEGNVHKGHADYVAQTAESQTNELNALLRGITGRRGNAQRQISLAQQNAAQRALERARNMPAPPPPVAKAPVAQTQAPRTFAGPIQRAVANNPAARPAVGAPVKTPAQLAQERRWLEYVKFNPQNARRVVLAARAKAAGRR